MQCGPQHWCAQVTADSSIAGTLASASRSCLPEGPFSHSVCSVVCTAHAAPAAQRSCCIPPCIALGLFVLRPVSDGIPLGEQERHCSQAKRDTRVGGSSEATIQGDGRHGERRLAAKGTGGRCVAGAAKPCSS